MENYEQDGRREFAISTIASMLSFLSGIMLILFIGNKWIILGSIFLILTILFGMVSGYYLMKGEEDV